MTRNATERRPREGAESAEAGRAPTGPASRFGRLGARAPRTPLEAALDAVGERARLLIVWHLFWGPRPFCDLRRAASGVSKKGLHLALLDMEARGLVKSEVRFRADGKAEFSLTSLGETLKPIVASLYEWGLRSRGYPIRDPRPRPGPKRA